MIENVKDINSLKLQLYKLNVESKIKEDKISKNVRSLFSLNTLRLESMKEVDRMFDSAKEEDGKLMGMVKKFSAYGIGFLVKKFLK